MKQTFWCCDEFCFALMWPWWCTWHCDIGKLRVKRDHVLKDKTYPSDVYSKLHKAWKRWLWVLSRDTFIFCINGSEVIQLVCPCLINNCNWWCTWLFHVPTITRFSVGYLSGKMKPHLPSRFYWEPHQQFPLVQGAVPELLQYSFAFCQKFCFCIF